MIGAKPESLPRSYVGLQHRLDRCLEFVGILLGKLGNFSLSNFGS